MKAIHNQNERSFINTKVGNYMLKYNFESNSQPNIDSIANVSGWELYAKIQF